MLAEWLFRFAALYSQEPNEAIKPAWAESLQDIPLDTLEASLREVEKTFIPTSACPFPTPAHVRQICEKAHKVADQLDGETAWQKLLRYIDRNFLGGDIGLKPSAPPLPPAVEHAQRAAGGLQWIEGCPADQLQWAKKRFIEAYETFSKSADLKSFASREDARHILAETARCMDTAVSALPAAPNEKRE